MLSLCIFFCIAFYSSIDPAKGRGLDEKKHTVAYLIPSKIKNFILSSLSLSLSLSLSPLSPPQRKQMQED